MITKTEVEINAMKDKYNALHRMPPENFKKLILNQMNPIPPTIRWQIKFHPPMRADKIRWIPAMRQAGFSYSQIEKILDVSRPTVATYKDAPAVEPLLNQKVLEWLDPEWQTFRQWAANHGYHIL